MSLIAVNLFKTARSKFFMNATFMMSSKIESGVLGQRDRNKPNGCYLVRNCDMLIFHEYNVHDVGKGCIICFLRSRGRNEPLGC